MSGSSRILQINILARWFVVAAVLYAAAWNANVTASDIATQVTQMRIVETGELGIAQVGALAFSPEANLLYVLTPPTADDESATIATITLHEESVDIQHIPFNGTTTLAMVAYDNEIDQLVVLEGPDRLLEIPVDVDGELKPDQFRSSDVAQYGLVQPIDITYNNQNEQLYILDASGPRIVRVEPGTEGYSGTSVQETGHISTIDLADFALGDLQSMAVNPSDGHIFLLAKNNQQITELTISGTIIATHDLSQFDLHNPQGMVFAPSGDQTDSPDTVSLYLMDSDDAISAIPPTQQGEHVVYLPLITGNGTSGGGTIPQSPAAQTNMGRLYEFSFDSHPSVRSAAADIESTLVRTTDTSNFSPPSPDSAGIAYLTGADHLLISDSEVNEMSIFEGANLFETSRSGNLLDTGLTTSFSDEPTGVAYNPANQHIFISDDDADQVFEVDPGNDGRYGTSDDTVTSIATSPFGSNDPEGVTYAPDLGALFIVDGVNNEVYRIDSGNDGLFGTSDDQITQFDTAVLDVNDPEGIAYDQSNGYLYIVGKPENEVAEITPGGTLVRRIGIAAANPDKPAGLAYGPGSQSGNSLYIVARGVDNNSNSSENDGMMYEVTFPSGSGGGNLPPTVNAGSDQTITLPADATLNASATDDGQPSSQLTTTWSKVSGPGNVTFGNASNTSTTATFTQPGAYVLRITADDSQLTSSDDINITVHPASGSSGTLDVRINSSSDDAEESSSGSMKLTSSDLELVFEGSKQQQVGMRFNGITIPQGAAITNAYIQFQVDEADNKATNLTIHGEATDNAGVFTSSSGNISSRPKTSASVNWSPPAWNTVGEAGPNQRTPNLAPVLQEIIGSSGWVSGNSLVIIVSGTGERTAESYNGAQGAAPLLHIEFSGTGNSNQSPHGKCWIRSEHYLARGCYTQRHGRR